MLELISYNYESYHAGGSQNFTIPSNTQPGDLIILHTTDGNNPGGQGEYVSGFTNHTGFSNGRALFSRIAISSDVGKTYTIVYKPDYLGWQLFVFRNASLHDVRFVNSSSSYSVSSMPQEGTAYHITYTANGGGSDFNIKYSYDSVSVIRTKNFSMGTTIIQTLPTGLPVWHSNNYNYISFIVVSTEPPASTDIEVATSDDGILFSEYVTFNPSVPPQKRYLKFRAKVSGGAQEGKTSTFEFDQSKPETKVKLTEFLESVSTNIKPKTSYTEALIQDASHTDGKLFTANVDKTIFKKITKLEVK